MKWTATAAGILTATLFTMNALAAPAPDFKLDAVNTSDSITLSKQRGKFVALHFLLKTECPICLNHVRTYAKAAASMPNVVQVFIKPDAEADIQAWTGKVSKDQPGPIVIYRDPDANLAEQYGIPGGYKFHGQVVHYPALVLIGPDGEEKFRYVGRANTDRFSVDQLKAKIEEVQRK